MPSVHTQVREIPAEYIRHGDEIATYRPAGEVRVAIPQSAKFVEENAMGIVWLLVVDDPKLIVPPAGTPYPEYQGHVGKRRIPCVPVLGRRLGFPAVVEADAMQQLVIRETVRIAEGQPHAAGVTVTNPAYRCPEFQAHEPHEWADRSHVGVKGFYWCNGFGHPGMAASIERGNVVAILRQEDLDERGSAGVDSTRRLSTSRIPVGVFGLAVGAHHDDDAAIDFKSTRDSESE